jgi:uracil permease
MNNDKNLLYDIREVPRSAKEWILYTLQQVLSIFVATVLIANICGTPISSCLFGAGVGTLIYQLITKFRSPMFISSCGATVSAVVGALALPSVLGNGNYLMVAFGGIIIALVYIAFALVVRFRGVEAINRIFPPVIVGPVTMVIGLNLAKFLVGYTSANAAACSPWQVGIAILTAIFIAISSHYFKGFWKTIPFLLGLAFGYILALIVTLVGWEGLIDTNAFSQMQWYPEFTFLNWRAGDFSWSNLGSTALLFIPVAICALLEHYSDHKCLSNIIGTDLTVDPGLDRTLVGDGVASAVGTVVCGLPNTSYGESIATTGFSRVASVWIITAGAAFLILMSFLAPVNAFIQTIPSCVFGGCAMILYGYITASGLKTLIRSKADLEDNKNLIIVSVILTTGVSGIFFLSQSFAGVSLAMVFGVILNLILKEGKKA